MISTSPAFHLRKDYLFSPSSLLVITQIGFSLSQWWIWHAHEPGHAAPLPLGICTIVPPSAGPTPERVRRGDILLPSVREVIDRLLFTGSRTQEASRASTLPQAFHRPIKAIHPPPGRPRASILLPLARPPISTSHLRAKTNGTRLLVLLLPCRPEMAILDTKGNMDPVPSTRTLAVTPAQT